MTTRPCGLRRAGNNSKSTIYNSPQHGKAITRARLELVFWSTDICHSAVGGGGYRIRRAVGLQLMSTCGLIAWQLTGRVRAVSDALLGEATRSKATVCRPCGVLLGQAWPAGHLLTSSRGRARAWDVCVCVCVRAARITVTPACYLSFNHCKSAGNSYKWSTRQWPVVFIVCNAILTAIFLRGQIPELNFRFNSKIIINLGWHSERRNSGQEVALAANDNSSTFSLKVAER